MPKLHLLDALLPSYTLILSELRKDPDLVKCIWFTGHDESPLTLSSGHPLSQGNSSPCQIFPCSSQDILAQLAIRSDEALQNIVSDNCNYDKLRACSPGKSVKLYEQIVPLEALILVMGLAKSYNKLALAFHELAIRCPLESESNSALQAIVEKVPHLQPESAAANDQSARSCIKLLRQCPSPLDCSFDDLIRHDPAMQRDIQAMREALLDVFGLA
jgi:hypothetical protein